MSADLVRRVRNRWPSALLSPQRFDSRPPISRRKRHCKPSAPLPACQRFRQAVRRSTVATVRRATVRPRRHHRQSVTPEANAATIESGQPFDRGDRAPRRIPATVRAVRFRSIASRARFRPVSLSGEHRNAATIGSGNRSTVPEASAPVSGQAVTPEANAATIERRAACLSGNRSTVRRLSIRRTSNAPQPFRKIKLKYKPFRSRHRFRNRSRHTERNGNGTVYILNE